MYLPTLTDREILTYAYQADRLTVSDLELQLAARLETALNEAEEFAPVVKALDDTFLGSADLIALFDVLEKHGIETSSGLAARLRFADEFRVFAEENGEVFTRLQTLVTQSQE